MRFAIVIAILLFLISSCDESVDYAFADDSAYYPLKTGMVWVDSMTQITIDDPSGVYDTVTWLEKTVVDSMQSINNLEKYFCTNYLYDKTLNRWELNYLFWYERSDQSLIKFTQNNIWLELVFPMSQGTSWNYYTYSILSDTSIRSTVHEIDQMNNIQGNVYDSTLIVHHNMDSTLIYKYTDESFYARNVGLLYREKVSIISDDPDYDYTLPIEERIKTATIFKQKRYYGDIY